MKLLLLLILTAQANDSTPVDVQRLLDDEMVTAEKLAPFPRNAGCVATDDAFWSVSMRNIRPAPGVINIADLRACIAAYSSVHARIKAVLRKSDHWRFGSQLSPRAAARNLHTVEQAWDENKAFAIWARVQRSWIVLRRIEAGQP